MKKTLREMQTLCSGCSKAEPIILAPPQTPFPGVQDRQNLISWSWSLQSQMGLILISIWILVIGVSLEKVDKFCYLGDMLDADGGCDSAVTTKSQIWLEKVS